MRMITFREKKQRGCEYCIHSTRKPFPGITGIRTWCPYQECPYHVLDNYETYEAFTASDDSKILVDGFFSTAANCYTMQTSAKSVRQMYADSIRHI